MPLARLHTPANWIAVAAAISAAMLAAAHAFERLGGYLPCPLCLRQREVYWAALALSAAALMLHRRSRLDLGVACALLGALFLTGALVAGFHAGVEWGWWPGTASCFAAGAGAPVSAAGLAELLGGAQVRAPSCDVAAWRLAGLSMAGWNALASAGLAAVSFAVAARGARRESAA